MDAFFPLVASVRCLQLYFLFCRHIYYVRTSSSPFPPPRFVFHEHVQYRSNFMIYKSWFLSSGSREALLVQKDLQMKTALMIVMYLIGIFQETVPRHHWSLPLSPCVWSVSLQMCHFEIWLHFPLPALSLHAENFNLQFFIFLSIWKN